MVLPHMHKKKSQIMGWGRFNLVCNAKEKMLDDILKDGMIRRIKSQTLDLGLA